MALPTISAEQNPPQDSGSGKDAQSGDGIFTTNGTWKINASEDITYSNITILCNGNLEIESSGKLTLENVTLWMNYTNLGAIPEITVKSGGTLIIKNNSTVTNYPGVYGYPGNPDRYEFKVQAGVPGGSLTLQNSTVENMADLSGQADGIQCYSTSVTIENSTIRNGSGNGIYVSQVGITITGCNVTENNWSGVYFNNADNNEIYGNNITENKFGINLNGSLGSHNNNITNNFVDSNQRFGIYVCGNDNFIGGNTVTNNTNFVQGYHWYAGIIVSGNNNNITYNNCSYHYHVNKWYSGISIIGSPDVSNNISHNNVTNNTIGIILHSCRNNIIFGNTIKDNQYYGIFSGGASAGSNNNTIEGNYLFNNEWYGILLSPYQKKYSRDEKIVDNYIENNTKHGACIKWAKDLNITGNYFNNNGDDGLYIGNSASSSTTNITFNITQNHFFNNTYSGIALFSSNSINVSGNNFSLNNNGIYLYQSSEIDIYNNNISENNEACINIILSDNITVKANPNINNSEFGIRLSSSNDNYIANNPYIANNEYGMRLVNSINNTITLNNKIIYNTEDGIYLNGTSGSHWNIITNNNISNNTKTGVKLSKSDNNTICSNNILFNQEYGIALIDSYNNTICHNTIYGNGIYGLYIEGDYRNNITQDNTINGENVLYFYNLTGNSTLNATAQNNTLTAENVTNVGKINFVECDYFYVSNNSLSNATKGIFLYNSNNITIDNNIIYDIDEDGEYGIYIEEDYRHNITNTTTVNGENIYYYYNLHGTQNNLTEIEIPQSEQPLIASHVSNVGKISIVDCSYLLVRNNTLSNGSSGIFLFGSQETTILNNTISDSEEFGLYIGEGCQELTLWYNNITDSGELGFYISEGYYHHYISQNNTVKSAHDEDWEKIHYFTDNQTITVNEINLTNKMISNVGKLSFINCTNITITDNTLGSLYWNAPEYRFMGGDGIFLYSSNNCTIDDNTLYDKEGDGHGNRRGIRLIESDGNNITNCSFGTSNLNGILFEHSNNNSVDNCTFNHGHFGFTQYGIIVTDSNYITIENNNMTKTLPGGKNGRGVTVSNSDNITILSNIFNGMDGNKIGISVSDSVIRIEDNFITNYNRGLVGFKGCDLSTKILNNTIVNITGLAGIYLYPGPSSPWIEGNNISNVHADGITVYHYDSAPYIYNNTISNTGLMGIQLEDSNATIIENEISDVHEGINVNWNPTDPLITPSNATIINNTIWDCKKKSVKPNYPATGILVAGYSMAYIYNNTIYDCEDSGIQAYPGTFVNISNNNCSYNKIGIRFLTIESNLTIRNNIAIGNSLHGIYVQNSNNTLIVDNNTVINNTEGIVTWGGSPSITNNTVNSNDYGIVVGESSPFISRNIIEQNINGINVTESSSPTIQNNYISESVSYGIYIQNSSNCLIYHNNLINNTNQAYDNTNDSNQWDNGYPSGGNYWSDFDEDSEGAFDDYQGAEQNLSGSDGMVDNGTGAGGGKNPYVIDADSQDTYPLIDPWGLVHNINKDIWYFKIQKGIDEANSSDTLEAMMGTYQENVIVNKTVNITGKYGATRTIIDGGGSGVVVNITANWVNITGFTVQNGIRGIVLQSSNNNTIINNTILLNNVEGILINLSNDNNIIDNNISNNAQGINITQSSNNTIENNTISYNNFGIHLVESNNTLISENDIYNSTEGIHVDQSNSTTIEYNNILYNEEGFSSFNSSSIIRYNNISYNDDGIAECYHSNTIIGNNTITNNNGSGIAKMFYSNASIDNNTISNNTVGIFCGQSSPSITYNNITFNTNGIDCRDGSNPTIHMNNIHNNTNYNLNNSDPRINISAENNWWGSVPPTGIIGSVSYNPYLLGPVVEAGPD